MEDLTKSRIPVLFAFFGLLNDPEGPVLENGKRSIPWAKFVNSVKRTGIVNIRYKFSPICDHATMDGVSMVSRQGEFKLKFGDRTKLRALVDVFAKAEPKVRPVENSLDWGDPLITFLPTASQIGRFFLDVPIWTDLSNGTLHWCPQD
jgi:hypothetical protein